MTDELSMGFDAAGVAPIEASLAPVVGHRSNASLTRRCCSRAWRLMPAPARMAMLRRATRLPLPVRRKLAGPPISLGGRTLDPDTQLLLRTQALSDLPALERGGVAAARKRIEAAAAAGASKSAHLAHAVPLVLDAGTHHLPARWYVPQGRPLSGGLILFFHGGGFVAGSIDTHDDFCRCLTHEVATSVVSVNYRLAPEHPFPAQIEDAHAAFGALVRLAPVLGCDPDRIGVCGDSAGGNLAAAVAAHRSRSAVQPACQLLVYPWLDIGCTSDSAQVYGADFGLTLGELAWYRDLWLASGTDPRDPACSPLFAEDLLSAAPAFILTAGFDPLRDDGDRYAARLREAGVPVTSRCRDGLAHSFVENLGLCAVGREAVRELGQAAAELLAPRS